MKSSKRSVKRAIRSRRSSKPKVMAGRLSAIEGACEVGSGARMALVEREGSNRVDIVDGESWPADLVSMWLIKSKAIS